MQCQIDAYNSYASAAMMHVTLFRNQPGVGNKMLAQLGYAVVAFAALAETVSQVAYTAFSLLLLPLDAEPFQRTLKRLQSSSFCTVWALVGFVLNPFMVVLVADERSARRICKSGDLMRIPRGAVI